MKMKMKIAIRHLLVLVCSAILFLILDISYGFGQIPQKLKIKFVDYFSKMGLL